MKPLICTTLALSMLAIPALAQGVTGRTEDKATTVSPSVAVGPPQSRTDGGDSKKDPDPHIYKLGDHLSMLYGSFDLVDDWNQHKLKAPPTGEHWVRYGDNFMRVKNTDGLITQIVKAS